MIEVIMPKVDMAMTEGTIALWRYRAGEAVRAGEPLFDITTDKADVEVEAPASGTLWDVRATAGQTIPIGQPVAFILAPGEQPPGDDEGRTTKDEGRPTDAAPQSSVLGPQSSVFQRQRLTQHLHDFVVQPVDAKQP
jgi:pyruvate/2-oxoglutarate dehydrogenase complex dihydrolipoamide acyltransferase (E2) component